MNWWYSILVTIPMTVGLLVYIKRDFFITKSIGINILKIMVNLYEYYSKQENGIIKTVNGESINKIVYRLDNKIYYLAHPKGISVSCPTIIYTDKEIHNFSDSDSKFITAFLVDVDGKHMDITDELTKYAGPLKNFYIDKGIPSVALSDILLLSENIKIPSDRYMNYKIKLIDILGDEKILNITNTTSLN